MLSQLGPYIIDEELARGGMARVFRARLRGLGGFEKTLVIKQIHSELAKDPRFVELFVREANTLVSLSHPHIVPVYELGAAEGSYYLSMEYVEGATLLDMLRDGPLAPALVAHIGAQVSEALEYAHSRFGILHRDITPSNIIVDHAGHTRVVDFGIAASADAVDPVAFGSPGYMAPEQVEQRRVTAQSDLFSLGAVLFEALTGRPAFERSVRGSLLDAPSFAAREVPEELRTLVLSMLAKQPAQRPGSAAEVARTLRALLARIHPHGVLDDMQRRVREARQRKGTPQRPSQPPEPSTARIEARAIATSPVLTDILRSSAFAPVPTAPNQPPASGTSHAPASNHAAEPSHTVPLPGRQRSADASQDTTNARFTAWLLRAWPFVALLSLLTAWALHARNKALPLKSAPPVRAPATPVRDTPASEPEPARAREPTTQAAPPPAAEERAQDGDAGSAAPATGWVQVSVNAKPWAELSVDGRALGTTPLRKLRLRPGSHLFVLSCPPLGRSHTLKLDLAHGSSPRVLVDLTESPPRAFLDGTREAR